jgi:uncharacterized membrane protein YedE/YeeE
MSRRDRMPAAFALLAGVVFGFGLALAQMTDPAKIRSFLDVAAISAGTWDPSLAVVMAGALVTAMVFYRLAASRRRPILAAAFNPPGVHGVDLRLVGGAALFGTGWGLSGLCPGPAIADLAADPLPALGFVGAMMVGSWIAGLLTHTGGFGASLAEAPQD